MTDQPAPRRSRRKQNQPPEVSPQAPSPPPPTQPGAKARKQKKTSVVPRDEPPPPPPTQPGLKNRKNVGSTAVEPPPSYKPTILPVRSARLVFDGIEITSARSSASNRQGPAAPQVVSRAAQDSASVQPPAPEEPVRRDNEPAAAPNVATALVLKPAMTLAQGGFVTARSLLYPESASAPIRRPDAAAKPAFNPPSSLNFGPPRPPASAVTRPPPRLGDDDGFNPFFSATLPTSLVFTVPEVRGLSTNNNDAPQSSPTASALLTRQGPRPKGDTFRMKLVKRVHETPHWSKQWGVYVLTVDVSANYAVIPFTVETVPRHDLYTLTTVTYDQMPHRTIPVFFRIGKQVEYTAAPPRAINKVGRGHIREKDLTFRRTEFEPIINFLHPVTLIWHTLPRTHFIPEAQAMVKNMNLGEVNFDYARVTHFCDVVRFMYNIEDTPTNVCFVNELPGESNDTVQGNDGDEDENEGDGVPFKDPCSSPSGSSFAGGAPPDSSSSSSSEDSSQAGKKKGKRAPRHKKRKSSNRSSDSPDNEPRPSFQTVDRKRRRMKAKNSAPSSDVNMQDAQDESTPAPTQPSARRARFSSPTQDDDGSETEWGGIQMDNEMQAASGEEDENKAKGKGKAVVEEDDDDEDIAFTNADEHHYDSDGWERPPSDYDFGPALRFATRAENSAGPSRSQAPVDDNLPEDNDQLELDAMTRKEVLSFVAGMTKVSKATGKSWFQLLSAVGAAVRLSRPNDFVLYQKIFKMENPGLKEPFEGHAARRAAEYRELRASLNAKDWDRKIAEWKERLAADGQLIEDGKPADPNLFNREVEMFMDSVIRQVEDFAQGVTNVSPVEVLTLVYTKHPTSRGTSQIVTSSDGFRALFANQPYGVRDLIEWIIDHSSNPEGDLGNILNALPTSAPNKRAPPAGGTSKTGPAASHPLAQSATSLEELETDLRGLVGTFRSSRKIPDVVRALKDERHVARKWVALLIQGLFADEIDVPRITAIWKSSVLAILRKHKLRLIWPSSAEPWPGSPKWNPSVWSTSFCKAIIKFILGDPIYIQLVRWDPEESSLDPYSSEYALVPLIQSCSKSRPRLIAAVRDDAKWVKAAAMRAAGSLVPDRDRPLIHARGRKELLQDVDAALNLKLGTARPEIKNRARLNEFLTKIRRTPISDEREDADEGEEEEEEEEELQEEQEEEQTNPRKRRRV